jgi:hypothetical protein
MRGLPSVPPFLSAPLDSYLSNGFFNVKFAFPLRFRDLISALKGFRHVAATLALKALQIERAVPLLVDLDRDRFL